jgi:hypothetical protein
MRVNPVKVDYLKRLAEKYPTKDDFAEDIIVKLSRDDSAKDTEIADLKQQVEELQVSLNAANQNNFSDFILIPRDPMRDKCLNYLLERERKYLGKGEELNEGVVYNYILDEILIKGNKFSIKSISDSKLEQFKKELECSEN